MTDVAPKVRTQPPAPPPARRGDEATLITSTDDEPAPVTLRPSRRQLAVVLGHGLTLFAVLVVVYVLYLVGFSALEQGRSQRTLAARFEQAVAFQEAPVGGSITEGTPVAVLDIPRLGLREVVVEGTTSRELRNGPGHLRSSALPGQAGNSVIAARRAAYGGSFRELDRLRPGDEIRATTGLGEVTYEVTETREVRPEEPDALGDFGDDRMTFVTSAPAFLASRRLVAVAELRSDVLPTPDGRPSEVRKEELGLHGDRSGALQLLLWTQALFLAAMATAWLYRRWSRWPTWLITTPVLALLLLLVFDSFTPLLPSTL